MAAIDKTYITNVKDYIEFIQKRMSEVYSDIYINNIKNNKN